MLQHKNDDTLTNVSLAECRVPTNFGGLEAYKKNLATFLLNLSRHKDDPIVSVTKKLENRSGQALACKNRVEEVLALAEPNLITLKCLNEEQNELYRFYTEQSSYLKWSAPSFVISSVEMTDLRERLLTKIDSA